MAFRCEDELVVFMRVHPGEVGSRPKLARRFGVSPNTVSNRVERATKQCFGRFWCACRMAAARRLLEETQLDIGQIARRLGFSRGQSFSRAFRRFAGCAPSQYRKAVRAARAEAFHARFGA